MSLNMGGDDITEFLYVLLQRINFPYRELNLARSYDWDLMEDLKKRLCKLTEGAVALNLYDFVVRRPGKAAEKYGLRAYDEIILAPMCLFEPRVIEFDRKQVGLHSSSHPDVSDEIIEHQADHVTSAMMISTQHLLPPAMETNGSINQDQPMGDANVSIEVVDLEEDTKVSVQQQNTSKSNEPPSIKYPGGLSIDVCFEASKLPLDVAIFNSARAAGGDEKIRKYLQAVLVVGGTALIPGMAHALESRLQAIATPLVPNMEKVQIIPPPKEIDPRVLAWKGAAVLGKMDGVSELWMTAADWDVLGMRGLKERCFYL